MNSNQEEDEFVAVRVQDPRVQNEGSWNSYVDFKIFLHTNSKAFTAKTSCVRRRYSEFVWLRKKMQKNAGLVPVPDLPGKSFFSFSGEDFLEKRRKGLQAFLEKVVHTTVCLSDSQLHLFMQTQLPIGHILDCVQGHTPYSVTDAILTYASSNRGLAQAQEDDSLRDSSLTVSYESMESPAPHPPCPPCPAPTDTFAPELLSCEDSDPLEGFLDLGLQDSDESQAGPSIRISQRSHHLEAVVEERGPPQARFYLGGGSPDDTPSLGPADPTQPGGSEIRTPATVHSAVESEDEKEKEGASCEPEECESSGEMFACKDDNDEERVGGNHVGSALEHLVVFETETKPHDTNGAESRTNEEETQQTDRTRLSDRLLDDARGGEDGALRSQGESGEDGSQSPPSSDGSIVKVSDEESGCEDADVSVQTANGGVKTAPGVNILELQTNGCSEEEEEPGEGPRDAGGKSPDVNSVAGDGDLTENSDISILESSSAPGLVESKCAEDLTALSLDAAEETQEVEKWNREHESSSR